MEKHTKCIYSKTNGVILVFCIKNHITKISNEIGKKLSDNEAIEKIKNGYRLKEESDEKYLKNAFRDYNGSRRKVPYSIATMDSLKRLTHGSFENLIFVKKEK